MQGSDLDSPLGSYGGRDEYQIGTRLVWVCFPWGANHTAITEQARQWLPEVWSHADEVLALATQVAREMRPDIWPPHDEAGTSGRVLDIWGIELNVTERVATFDVNRIHEFAWSRPDLPEWDIDLFLNIRLREDGSLVAVGSPAG